MKTIPGGIPGKNPEGIFGGIPKGRSGGIPELLKQLLEESLGGGS